MSNPSVELQQQPPWWLRAFATVGTPLALGVFWYCGYSITADSGAAPTGDTWFAWMPLVPLLLVPVCMLVGLVGSFARSKRATLVVAWVLGGALVVVLFVLVPGYGTPEGFPAISGGPMAFGAMAGLLPVVSLMVWPRSSWRVGALGLVLALGTGCVALATLGARGDPGSGSDSWEATPDSWDSPEQTPTDGVEVAWTDLRVGDCIHDVWADDNVVVPCSDPHSGEVILADESFYARDSAAPPEDRVTDREAAAAEAALEAYTGQPPGDGPHDYVVDCPDAREWANGVRRMVVYGTTLDSNDNEVETTGSMAAGGGD